MRVFVTGASGLIGSAVVPDLVEAGHEVVGLARSEESAAAVKAMGAEVRRGDLTDLDGLREAVTWADGVIHLAFDHATMRTGDMAGAAETDLAAVRVIAEALAGTGKAMASVSGTLAVSELGRIATEEDADNPAFAAISPRSAASAVVEGLADRGVRVSFVRIPPVTHGEADRHGFIPTLIAIAREIGVSGYLGDGANRWPSGHALDVGRVFRLALEKAPAGARLHPAGDEGVPTKVIAEAIGRGLGVPVESVADPARFRFLAPFMGLDNPVSTVRTREMLGWAPAHPGLIADIDAGHYFAV
ncbi:MAG TPA: SDR family oxidoreductase [Pseudonocardiaceae bacterium]|nr:SDR family oxidoreductase [Pseudonocardiaceae bacterium]